MYSTIMTFYVKSYLPTETRNLLINLSNDNVSKGVHPLQFIAKAGLKIVQMIVKNFKVKKAAILFKKGENQ